MAYGLVICCFAAARDGLDKTIQYTIDGSCNPGIFSLVSVPNIVGCVGAAIIIIAAIATPIAKSQNMSANLHRKLRVLLSYSQAAINKNFT